MQIGKLRHRVTIQEKAVVRDDFGGETITWSDVDEVWAAVEPLQGREFLEGRTLEAAVDTRIRIRYRSGIVPEMRVVWGAHVYDVQAALDPKGERKELHLMSREIVA